MESKSSARRLATRDKEHQALDLRRKGYTHRRIGQEMGISEDYAYILVRRALERLNENLKEKADEVRRLEVTRYDAYLLALQPAVESGDTRAITTALRVSECRRKLLGVDTPVVQQVEVKTQIQGDQLAQVQAELLKKLEKLPGEDK